MTLKTDIIQGTSPGATLEVAAPDLTLEVKPGAPSFIVADNLTDSQSPITIDDDYESPQPIEVKRGRGRPKKVDTLERLNSVTQAPQRQPKIVAPPVITTKVVNYDEMGKVAATLFFGVGEMVLGADWAPENDEPKIVSGAFGAYFKSVNMTDIPPGFALSIVLVSYAAQRVQRPTIKSRISGAMLWTKNKIKR